MFGNFFRTAHVDAFVVQIVQAFLKAAPPAQMADGSRKAAKKRDQLDEQVRKQAEQFAREYRLNVFQKARLGSQLQDGLEQAGY
ncbi:MAG: hypothetical protein EOO54_17695, partial [Haliea sp.]